MRFGSRHRRRKSSMTSQIPDRLHSEYTGLVLGNLVLYRILTGDIRRSFRLGVDYCFAQPPIVPPHRMCSALWRGYVATFHLRASGQLELTRYDYPLSKPSSSTDLSERLIGDFWLVMGTTFRGPRVYVPFVDGYLNPDEAAWVVTDGVSLDSVRHFQSPKVEEPPNIPLESPVFLGTVCERFPHPILDDCIVMVRLDRRFLQKYAWCACNLMRSKEIVASTELCSTRLCGPDEIPLWGLNGLTEADVEINDELWAIERQPVKPYVLQGSFIGFGDVGVWASDLERDTFLDWFAEQRCAAGDAKWAYCKSGAQRQVGWCIDLGNALIQQGEILAITSDEYDQAAAQYSPDFARLLGIIESITRGDWQIRVEMKGATGWRRETWR